MKKLILPLICIAALPFLAGGCQTYDQQTKAAREAWRSGDAQGAATLFAKVSLVESKKNRKDQVIWRLEEGEAWRGAGKWIESNVALEAAQEKMNYYDEQAKVSLTREALALFSNQATLPYEGRDYDKIMLNTYKALNFMQSGEMEKARVEIIRAYQRQQESVQNNQRRIQKLQDEMAKAKQKSEEDKAAIEAAEKSQADPKFQQELHRNLKHLEGFRSYADYANPFTVYLDGLFFMSAATGGSDLERAKQSFERTVALTGENKFIKQDIECVEKIVNGESIQPTVYIIFETGCAPIREQIQVPVPLFLIPGANSPTYVQPAFPVLRPQDGHLEALIVNAGGTSESTVLLSSMDSVVAQAFKDELPIIISKTIASATLKAAAQYGINEKMKKEDAMARLLVKVILAAIEASTSIADTRTWTTLPKEFQFCRIPMPADGKLTLSGASGAPTAEVSLEKAEVLLVYVKSTSASAPLYVSQIKLKAAPQTARDDDGAPEPSLATATPASK